MNTAGIVDLAFIVEALDLPLSITSLPGNSDRQNLFTSLKIRFLAPSMVVDVIKHIVLVGSAR